MRGPAAIAPETARDVVIDVNGLTKSFGGRVVVRDLSMQSGAARSSASSAPTAPTRPPIRMLCGLLTPDQGSGTCLGFDIRTEAAKIKTRVGYMTHTSASTRIFPCARISNSSRASTACRARRAPPRR
jgi:ABC-2 type transport system ATP-binding protein